MQALLGSYRWDWKDLRAQLPGLAAVWIPDADGDLIARVSSMCTCRTAGRGTCRAGAPPGSPVTFSSRPNRSWRSGSWAGCSPQGCRPAGWPSTSEVYGRSEELRKKAAKAGLSYVAIIPCDYQVTLPSGVVIRADEAVKDAIFERRSRGYGSKGPRDSDWAMIAIGIEGQYLLIRRLISRPDHLTFYLCWVPPGRPAAMTYFITIAGRRWPVEETFKTGKDVFGWDRDQVWSWNGICRHTALAASRPAPGRRHPQRAHRPHPAPRHRPHRRRQRYHRR